MFFADDVPPYFKTEPARSQLNLERNKVVLTCMAEGSWPLEFKWIHNNTELTRFSLEYRSEGSPRGRRYIGCSVFKKIPCPRSSSYVSSPWAPRLPGVPASAEIPTRDGRMRADGGDKLGFIQT